MQSELSCHWSGVLLGIMMVTVTPSYFSGSWSHYSIFI